MTRTAQWENVPTSFCSELRNEEKPTVPHVARQGETWGNDAFTGHLTVEVTSLRTSFPRLQDEEAGLNDDRMDTGEGVAVSQTLY